MEGKAWISHAVSRLRPTTVLDVGPGQGTYADLLRSCTPGALWSCVEIFAPYVQMFGLHSKYDTIYVADIRGFAWPGRFDVVILGDVLEHMALGAWPSGPPPGHMPGTSCSRSRSSSIRRAHTSATTTRLTCMCGTTPPSSISCPESAAGSGTHRSACTSLRGRLNCRDGAPLSRWNRLRRTRSEVSATPRRTGAG